MAKQVMENEVRNRIHDIIIKALKDAGEEALSVANNEDTCPQVDSEGNELYVNIKISVPRGTRIDGGYEPYDGYAAHEAYLREVAQNEENKKKREAERKKKAEDKAKRAAAAKKTIKTMKKDVEEIFGDDNGEKSE